MSEAPAKRSIGVALGSGSSRGWAHIGVLRALEERGLAPSVVAGASAGALVGAAYASGQMEELEAWATSLSRVDVWRLLDTTVRRGGMMTGDRLMRAIREHLEDHEIEELPVPFGAVATELATGLEVWLQEGSMLAAVRASSGLPGLFTPVWHQGRWLIDGGVVNSVPVSLCRALGADLVVAVNLNKYLRAYPVAKLRAPEQGNGEERRRAEEEHEAGWTSRERWAELFDGLVGSLRAARGDEPGLFDVIGASISIMQDRITRSRMVGEPPDVVVEPDLGHFELMDFHRAEEAIERGRDALDTLGPELERLRSLLD